MWEERDSRKYVAPHNVPDHQHTHSNDPTEDLHAWSIYRQNLNADLSESAIGRIGVGRIGVGRMGVGKIPGEKPFGNFQLKESTVANILTHPKYGPSNRNHDPYTYLRFGLPRVKSGLVSTGALSELGGRRDNDDTARRVSTGGGVNTPPDSTDEEMMDESFGRGLSEGRRMRNGNNNRAGGKQRNGGVDYGHNLPPHSSAHSSHGQNLSSSHGQVHSFSHGQNHSSSHGQNLSSSHGQVHPQFQERNQYKSTFSPNQRNRIWKSQPDLVNVAESTFMNQPSSRMTSGQNGHVNGNGIVNGNGNGIVMTRNSGKQSSGNKALSEVDLTRTGVNGHVNGGFNGHMGKSGPSSINGHSVASQSLSSKHPHLIIRNLYCEVDQTSKARRVCGAQRHKLRLLDNISFDVKSGEIFAILATNATEGTAILDILADKYNKSKCKVKGDFILNGVYLTPNKLSQLVAYVDSRTELCPEITARQSLLFTSLLQQASKRAEFDTKKRSNALLEELGLSEVRHSSISSLTVSEKKRLLIAVALLLDTDILILDQPVKGMDIFDSFFLIEYLRQWALISGRIVIMTIHPSTYEIFTMLSKVALISTGRTLYFGKRKDLLSYFSYIDYPCPAFKNPSDYYLDLVTLDNLSSEAMLESSQRIESLVQVFNSRSALGPADASRSAVGSIPLPGPASPLPQAPKKSGFIWQFLYLWMRSLIYTFPYNAIHMFRTIFISLLISILTGIIYWHVRAGREQEHLWDRIGFYHALLAITPIPIFLIILSEFHTEKQYVLTEIAHGFYGKGAYFFSKILYTFPAATLAFIAFSLPASSMAGLHNELSLYLLIMLAYLHAIRMVAIMCAWFCNSKSTAGALFGVIYSIIIFGSGTSIHYKDLSIVTKWINNVSPLRYTHEALIGWEFSSNVTLALATTSWTPASLPYLCSHNPIIQQENAILIKADCGFQSRANILSWFNYKGSSPDLPLRNFSHPFIASASFFALFSLLSFISWFFASRSKDFGKSTEGEKLSNNL